MSSKQYNPLINKPEAITSQELTPIWNQLLACARIRKPVLLYGNDTIGRKNLIYEINKRAMEPELSIHTKNPSESDGFMKSLDDMAFNLMYRSTVQYYIDCMTMDGKAIRTCPQLT